MENVTASVSAISLRMCHKYNVIAENICIRQCQVVCTKYGTRNGNDTSEIKHFHYTRKVSVNIEHLTLYRKLRYLIQIHLKTY